MIFTLIITMMSIVAMQPVYALAEEVETDSLNRGDSELNKSGEDIRNEIDTDTQELDTHGIKDIKDGKGKFYKAYQDEFDEMEENMVGGQVYVDLIKKFDYNKGSFKCGMTDVLCHITNVVYVAGTSTINFIMAPLEKLAIEPEKILGDSTFNKFKSNFNTFTQSLLGVFILFQIMKIYVFRMTNHADTIGVMNEKIIKIVMAGVFLFSYDLFFKLLLTIQYRVNFGIFSYVSNSNQVSNDLMLKFLLTPNGSIFVLLIVLYAVLLAVLFFQMAYTFGLIGLFYTVGPVAIVTMVNDEYNMFSMWLKTIIARFLTLALQGLTVMLSFSYASSMDAIFAPDPTTSAFQKVISLAFLLVGISIPGLLKEFGNSSGSGRGAISATQSMTRVITKR